MFKPLHSQIVIQIQISTDCRLEVLAKALIQTPGKAKRPQCGRKLLISVLRILFTAELLRSDHFSDTKWPKLFRS